MGYQIDFTGAELDNRLFRAGISLNLSQPEDITGDGTYKSPSTYVQVVPGTTPINFEYTGGQGVYTGDEDITVALFVTTSVTGGAGTTITITGGKNGTPDTAYEISNKLSNANDAKALASQSYASLSKNDTLNFYIKADANITMEQAIFNVVKIG